MRQLIYCSTANTRMAASVASEFLDSARAFNGITGITGLLCAAGDRFMQLLEGPEDSVDAAMARIREDPRHHAIDVLVDRPVTQRAFGDWSMAFREKGLPPEALAERVQVSLVEAPADVAERFRAFSAAG